MFPERMRSRLQQTWWSVFGLLIAVPALVLAGFGLRAIRADRIEREQQVREQQTQVARLADAALGNAVERVIAQLDRTDLDTLVATVPAWTEESAFEPFVLDAHDIVGFPRHRIYFGAAGQLPQFLQDERTLPPAVIQLVADAQAMEAQQRKTEAVSLYREAARNPRLHDWANLALARLDEQSTARLSDRHWAQSDAYTPAGVPIAIVASSAVDRVPERDRFQFAALIDDSLARLRRGVWWLSYDQRRVYDSELRRWLESADPSKLRNDAPSLEEIARAEQGIRRARRAAPAKARIETQDEQAFLIVWSRIQPDDGMAGAALSGSALDSFLNAALRSVFEGQPFGGTLHDGAGSGLWSSSQHASPKWHTESINAVEGLRLDFSAPAEEWGDRNRWMWYGVIALPLLMLMSGLLVTGRVMRQELALNHMQSRFLAAVSHELKSPITGIRLLMERIMNGRQVSPEAAREYCAGISRETGRLETLVNRLLESQKIQANARNYNFEPTSLAELAGYAVGRLSSQAEAKGIRLRSEVEPGVPDVEIDKAAVGDAIENLIDNAIKYSPAGTQVSVHIRAADHEVCVHVCDEGIGIEKADLPRIFDPFYRARRGDMENVKGTGLGLALVKAAAEAHGGTIDVSSQPNRGSRFTLRLPVARQR